MPAKAMIADSGATTTDLVLPFGVEPVAKLDGRRRRGAKPQAPSARTGEAGPLGKNANTAAIAGQDRLEKARAARSERMKARRQLSPLTTLKRVSRCGRVSVIEGGEVLLRAASADGNAGFGGLETCGSVWACPVCSAKISVRRATELEQLVRWNAQRGGSIALLTLTMRHNRGHRLRTLRKALQGAWRHVTASRAWKDSRQTYGRDGYVRALEATYGEGNGWHLHAHVLLVFDGPISQELADVLADELWDLWRDGLEAQGMTAIREHGLDLRVGGDAVDGMGKYLSKLTFEAAGGRWKQGRGGSRTPYQVLADFLAWGNADDWDIWEEWEQGSHGMRQLVWSRGLKDRAQVEEATDEEVAAEDQGGETIAVLPARTWREVWHQAEDLLTVVEQGGSAAAYAWLDRRGLAFDATAT